MNYANQNGKRFVVLTNGQVWRLYDNVVQGLLTDKLIAQASLQNTEQICDFLTMLSKSEVLSCRLERLAIEARERKEQTTREQLERQQREVENQRFQARQREILTLLNSTLPEHLRDPNDELVLMLTLSLNEQENFHDLAPETLAQWLDGILSQLPSHSQEEADTLISKPTFPSTHSIQQGGNTSTLKALQGMAIDGKNSHPVTLHTPDGESIPVKQWVTLAEEAVRWLLQQPRSVPVPFMSTHRTRWFLNHKPEHKKPDLRRKFKPITANGKTIYLDADRSGEMFLHDIHALCLAMQIAPEDFRITIGE